MNSQSLARGLAFFSLGLGLTELLAPRPLARAIGIDEDYENLLRVLGLREIGSGLGIMQGNTAGFLWSRVAGDAIDLGLLATALRSRKTNRNRALGAIAAVAGVTVVDVVAALMLSRNPADPTWRIARGDRSGMRYDNPRAMREHADATMQQHQSGHWRDAAREMPSREQQAIEQFEAGD